MEFKNSYKQLKKITLENFPGGALSVTKLRNDKLANKQNSDSKNIKKIDSKQNKYLNNRQFSDIRSKERNVSEKNLSLNKSIQSLEESISETQKLKSEENKINESNEARIEKYDEDSASNNLVGKTCNGSYYPITIPILTPLAAPLPKPTQEQRAKKSKPLSMGENSLKQIVNESMKKSVSRTRYQVPKKNNFILSTNQQIITNKNPNNKLSNSLQKFSQHSSNPVLTCDIGGPLSHSKFNKTTSNGIDQYPKSELGLLNIKTCPALNVTVSSCTNSFREGSNSKFKTDNFKLNEEILEYKLSNSKLKNDINILNEKITTMKKVINMKKEENDMLRSQYTEMIDDYKKEIDKLKKINFKYKLEEETQNGGNKDSKNKQTTSNFMCQSMKSTLSVLLDLLEIFIAPRQNVARQSINVENISASYSMDIYDSYNNDEERRFTMIEGIQGLLVAKLSVMKKNFQLDLEKEIERVKNWSMCRKEEGNSNILNISSLKMPKINDSGDRDENDFFDLSNSKLFVNQSPKFNSVELVGKGSSNIENINNYSLKKDDENQLLNDSFLKDLKQNDSFSDDKNGSLIANSNFNNPFIRISEGEQEIMDCSIIDLESKPLKETKMLFNDDPTEFNMEYVEDTPTVKDQLNLSLNNLNTTFEDKSEESQIPVILKPIVNTNMR